MDTHDNVLRRLLTLTDKMAGLVLVPAGQPYRVLTSGQVGAALRIPPGTIQYYARAGQIPCSRTPGGHRRFDLAEVRAALGIGAGKETGGSG